MGIASVVPFYFEVDMNKIRKTELLAPAGFYEAFEAALGAGADAVYAGGPAFGARAYAKNFTEEELIHAIKTAHIHGKKLYLTVNTLLKNREVTEKLYNSLLPFYEEGLDAVLVQDLGVLRFIRRTFPDLPVHASTQMAVTGPEGMRFLEELGVSRVVAARELSLEEIARMHGESPLEIEAFIHGALCYSISGQCLMSSILGGRSGNRGRCAQPCRLPYQVMDEKGRRKGGKDICPLSLKDICTLDILPEIIRAGVVSLKIEGRMKQSEYTAHVTGMYRKYLDIYEKYPEEYYVSEKDRRELLDIFSRGGSCYGYYRQHNGPDMMAFTNEKKTGSVSVELRKSKEKINGNLILYPESPAILELSCSRPERYSEDSEHNGGEKTVRVTAALGEVQYAKEHPVEETRVRSQMNKLGNTEFAWDHLDIQMGDNIFVPTGVLNELRRSAVSLLEEELVQPFHREALSLPVYEKEERGKTPESLPKLYVSCETKEQAEILMQNRNLTGLYLPFDVMRIFMDRGVQNDKELYLSMPYVSRGAVPGEFLFAAEKWLSAGMRGFLVRNLEDYGVLKEKGWQKHCVADASLYTWNNEAVAFWKEQNILRTTLPLELNEKELRHRNNSGSEMLIYGYLPLMESAQCVRKNLLGCDRKESFMVLKDRYGKEFVSACVCDPRKTGNTEKKRYCYNILYNSIPFGLLKECRQVRALGVSALRLSFTMESPEETDRIFREFSDVYLSGQKPADREYTKGHFKRGAE